MTDLGLNRRLGRRLFMIVPMVTHPLIRDQVNGKLLQAFCNQTLERFKISIFEKDVMPSTCLGTEKPPLRGACEWSVRPNDASWA
jgi:hypothetical protein